MVEHLQVKIPESVGRLSENLWTSLTDPNKSEDALLRSNRGMVSSRRAHGEWGVKRVGDWLASIGLGSYADVFEQHCITGDLLELLTEDHLKDFGVKVVGHRLLLMRELSSLKRQLKGSERTRVIWSGTEVRHRSGPFGYMSECVQLVPCCYEPAKYSLTASTLTIMESEHPAFPCCCLPPGTRTSRGIDLSSVGAVNAVASSRFWLCSCQADRVLIELHEMGLDDVPPVYVYAGKGEGIAQILRDAVEDEQSRAMQGPPVLSMNRTM